MTASVAGNYAVQLQVTDIAGNVATQEFKVTFEESSESPSSAVEPNENENLEQSPAGDLPENTTEQDTTPPTAVLAGVPADPSNGSSINIAVGGDDVVAYQYQLVTQDIVCAAASYGDSWTHSPHHRQP